MEDHEIKIVSYNDNSNDIISIRKNVFILEQSVSSELEIDGLDSFCSHVLVYLDGNAIATGRIQTDGHIGRVAVLKKYRGSGYGRDVINELISHAKKDNLNAVYLGAQLSAKKFYTSLGFKSYGELFVEANIKHIMMKKEL